MASNALLASVTRQGGCPPRGFPPELPSPCCLHTRPFWPSHFRSFTGAGLAHIMCNGKVDTKMHKNIQNDHIQILTPAGVFRSTTAARSSPKEAPPPRFACPPKQEPARSMHRIPLNRAGPTHGGGHKHIFGFFLHLFASRIFESPHCAPPPHLPTRSWLTAKLGARASAGRGLPTVQVTHIGAPDFRGLNCRLTVPARAGLGHGEWEVVSGSVKALAVTLSVPRLKINSPHPYFLCYTIII